MRAGEWWHSIDHGRPCRVVDTDALYGQITCLVRLSRRGTAQGCGTIPDVTAKLPEMSSRRREAVDALRRCEHAPRQ